MYSRDPDCYYIEITTRAVSQLFFLFSARGVFIAHSR